jgi:hypothetical protein
MSYESNDERIEKLEENFTALLNAQKAALRLHEGLVQGQGTMNISLLKEVFRLTNNQTALMRYITSSSLLFDKNEQKRFLDKVSGWEHRAEHLEKMLADLEKSPPKPLPPDESVSPGPVI